MTVGASQAQAQTSPPATTPIANPPGWAELVGTLGDLPARMLAKLTPEQRADPQIQQEVVRFALSALAHATLDALGQDGDHPVFMPAIGQVISIGQPNADTVYRTAKITPGGSYRLRGKRGSVRMARVAQVAPRPRDKVDANGMAVLGPPRIVFDINALQVDAQGNFDVIASPVRPAGYTGDWWQLQPDTNALMMRWVASDWGKEIDPTISIERVDGPIVRPRPPAALLEQRLRAMPGDITFSAMMFLDHVARLREQGVVNTLKVFDLALAGGLAGQFYYEGAYDLKPDEALIVEAKVPTKCAYHSVILTNELYETTDWYNNQSTLNDAQSRTDPDGILRVVISAKDPGVANWVDTSGYPTGVIQGRWTECDSQPVPTVRKVKVDQVARSLPSTTPRVTPEERERIIRDRRSALQQRPLW
ncbi:hypothetical protein [Novosphingobium sp. JCM 18896]|uniref:hypothetical protein n=1 Tax=Novosphingobium sp. JCM 18896 TaxID=2989731 RepID=UPI00222167FF|nr:hypothetical protein [Novosphingobium sp. JCM 18896]MCW1431690.1 hypothetical protein [Novosphingobium sp. JCM 18896]